ncbi:hypothetical protein SESBI_50614 [Sesbania bispinosa]|nr:hypothetical protein SESBI_50614 [Sesbania bispinosa]
MSNTLTLMAKFGGLSPFLVLFMLLSFQSKAKMGVGVKWYLPCSYLVTLFVDNGNNNNLPSFAKANYFPYGIDFKGGPTGRFSNGYCMVDEIGIPLSLINHFPFS